MGPASVKASALGKTKQYQSRLRFLNDDEVFEGGFHTDISDIGHLSPQRKSSAASILLGGPPAIQFIEDILIFVIHPKTQQDEPLTLHYNPLL